MNSSLQLARLTPEESNRVLDLATRLQAEHAGRIAVEDLARAAEEAGIEARFVHEAASRLRGEPRPATADSIPLLAFSLLVIEVVAYFYAAHRSLGHGGMRHGLLNASGAALIAFSLAIGAARPSSVRWFAPLAPVVVWTATAIPVRMLAGNMGYWVVPTAVFFGLVQTLAALAGTLTVAALAWMPRGRSAIGRATTRS